MAAKGGRPSLALIERLFREPYRFDFFQAVRVLEQAAAREARDPRYLGRAPVGEYGDPRQETVRFKATLALSFPPASIAELSEPAGEPASGNAEPPPAMAVNFMGLTGPSGVLPQHYTDILIQVTRSKSYGLRDFFDVFNHRLVSLFYRAWEKYRLPAAYEHFGNGGKDPISQSLYALAGFGTGHLCGRLEIDDEALLHYSGYLSHWPRSAAALESLLSDYAGRPVQVEQFHGHWLWLTLDQRSRMPSKDEPQGRFCELGVNSVVGERVWDVQGSFRLAIGPLSYAQFVRFMPTGDELLRLAQLTRLYVGADLYFDVQLTLAKEEIPACEMAQEGGQEGAYVPRLGWNTWLKSRPARRDSSDAVFSLQGWVVAR